MSATVRRLLVLASLAAAPGLGMAMDYEQIQGGARVQIQPSKAENSQAILQLSDEITLTVSIEGRAPLAIDGDDKALIERLDQALTVSDAWGSRGKLPRPTLNNRPDGRQRWELKFNLDPRNKGEYRLDLPPLDYREGGELRQVRWTPIKLLVVTRVEGADHPNIGLLKDIQGPEEVPERHTLSWWVWGLFAVGAMLLSVSLVVGLVQLLRSRSGQGGSLSPQQWALRELDRLEAQNLPASGQMERYHTLLSDVVRYYLEQRFRLRAPQQTTTEFLSTMQSWPLLAAPHQAILREFLERCDLAKFARANPSPEECQETARMARTFVEQTAIFPVAQSG
jgi:hypothetical protein